MWKSPRTKRRDLIYSGSVLVGLDCSWVNIESSVEQITKQTKLEEEHCLLFLANNPVNWGKFELSTAEALAASLWILGHEDQGRLLLKICWDQVY